MHMIKIIEFQIYEVMSAFRGELKNAARQIVLAMYNIFPPDGADLSVQDHTQYVRDAVIQLTTDGAFHKNGVDENVRILYCMDSSYGANCSILVPHK